MTEQILIDKDLLQKAKLYLKNYKKGPRYYNLTNYKQNEVNNIIKSLDQLLQ